MLTTEYMDIQAVTDYKQAGGGAAGVLNGAKLIFGTNAISPSKTSVVGDITQSVDAGLAPVTLTWGAAFRDAAGDIAMLSQSVPVQLASNANATTILSFGVTDSGGTHLLLCGNCSQPMPLPDTLALFNVQLPFSPPNPQGKDLLINS